MQRYLEIDAHAAARFAGVAAVSQPRPKFADGYDKQLADPARAVTLHETGSRVDKQSAAHSARLIFVVTLSPPMSDMASNKTQRRAKIHWNVP